MTGRTAGPWTCSGDSADGYTTCVVAAAPPYESVAVSIRRANAARIVECCNGWDALRSRCEALEGALSVLVARMGQPAGKPLPGTLSAAYEFARAALGVGK